MQLSLNKTSEVWWNAVLKGEKEIDVNQINRERSMATVDEEEHAVLDRLTFDYHQKLQGKPQSHELVGHSLSTGTSCCAETAAVLVSVSLAKILIKTCRMRLSWTCSLRRCQTQSAALKRFNNHKD